MKVEWLEAKDKAFHEIIFFYDFSIFDLLLNSLRLEGAKVNCELEVESVGLKQTIHYEFQI